MADRKKVINGLEHCASHERDSDKFGGIGKCRGCPYYGYECVDRLKDDALALLKLQQLDIEALKNTIQGMVEGHCIIAGDKRVDVIRCKDCVECYFASNRIQSEQTFACGKHGIDVTQDWFCADGVKKDG